MYKLWYFTSLVLATFIFMQFINFGAFALAMYAFTVYNVPYWFSGSLVSIFWVGVGYFVYSQNVLSAKVV